MVSLLLMLLLLLLVLMLLLLVIRSRDGHCRRCRRRRDERNAGLTRLSVSAAGTPRPVPDGARLAFGGRDVAALALTRSRSSLK